MKSLCVPHWDPFWQIFECVVLKISFFQISPKEFSLNFYCILALFFSRYLNGMFEWLVPSLFNIYLLSRSIGHLGCVKLKNFHVFLFLFTDSYVTKSGRSYWVCPKNFCGSREPSDQVSFRRAVKKRLFNALNTHDTKP